MRRPRHCPLVSPPTPGPARCDCPIPSTCINYCFNFSSSLFSLFPSCTSTHVADEHPAVHHGSPHHDAVRQICVCTQVCIVTKSASLYFCHPAPFLGKGTCFLDPILLSSFPSSSIGKKDSIFLVCPSVRPTHLSIQPAQAPTGRTRKRRPRSLVSSFPVSPG